MRRNIIATKVYRDVTDLGDDVRVAWFEYVSEDRFDDKLVMQFYREIDRPVDSLGRNLAEIAKLRESIGDAIKLQAVPKFMIPKPSRWARFVRWVRLQWFMMGAG